MGTTPDPVPPPDDPRAPLRAGDAERVRVEAEQLRDVLAAHVPGFARERHVPALGANAAPLVQTFWNALGYHPSLRLAASTRRACADRSEDQHGDVVPPGHHSGLASRTLVFAAPFDGGAQEIRGP